MKENKSVKKNIDILNNRKTIIVVIYMLIFVLIGGTLAFWVWESTEGERTNVSFVVDGDFFSCSADGGGEIVPNEVDIIPASCNSKENVIMREITTNADVAKDAFVTMDLWLNINEMGIPLSESEHFSYVLTTSSTSCTEGVVSSGNFNGKYTGDKVNIFSKSYKKAASEKYYLYLWLDEEETNAATAGQSFNLSLGGQCSGQYSDMQIPMLDEGMIPVVISDKGVATTVSQDDPSWYDYEDKKWANVVLVNKDATNGTDGSYSREYYLNNPDTRVLESDILGYYVWIPRYKYKIWTTEVSSTGKEQPIDIVFESKFAPISLGTNLDDYITHPAFLWDSNSDGNISDNEVLPGIWVGKFETTGAATTPTVKPNVASLRSQTVSTQFATALKFAGGSMNSSTGEVTFAGNNIYGLTAITDSHMMKNSEWGAVAYLSHSAYGINEEVRINNYYASSTTKTGCGATTANAATATTCGIPYGTPSAEKNTYPQSTTGNITGVFDMSGGAWDAVMGNYNKTLGSSGFSVFPKSKYYDLYTTTDISTACNNGICYGPSLSETNNWYGDYNSFLSSSYLWFLRGADYGETSKSGVFARGVASGVGDASYGSRSVLIPQTNYMVNFDVNGGNFVDISYTTAGQYEFVVPYDGEYQLELWGASGAGSDSSAGGKGGYVYGKTLFNNGEILNINVGGTDGYNGGGKSIDANPGYSGGGGSDVRYNGDTLHARIIVAAGGGGGQSYYKTFLGGNAGGLSGYSGSITGSDGKIPGGANQTSVGSGGYGTHGGIEPTFGEGGSGSGTGGGGGGGFYGAYAGPHGAGTVGSGGGGSSYISGHTGCVAIESATSTNPRTGTNSGSCTTGTNDKLCSVHYSNKEFTDTVMIDGAGYFWTSIKGGLQQMPNPTGGYYASGVGHTGDGAVRISQSSSKVVAYGKFYGDLPIPYREGYTFAGWYTEPDGGERVYDYTMVNTMGNRTLYAHWDVVSVSISYSVNGGIIQSSTTSDSAAYNMRTANNNTTYNLRPINSTTYNWSTTKDIIYLNNQVLNTKISFSETKNLLSYNDVNYMNITKEGHGVPDDKEWLCLSGCKSNNLRFSQNVEYTFTDFCDNLHTGCNVVLGVNFAKKFAVSFNGNGGNGGPDSQVKLDGNTLILSSSTPTRTGYIFLGWSDDPDATSPIYTTGSEFTINDNITLYAIWEKGSSKYTESILNGTDPELESGMIPVTISDTGAVTVADIKQEWYNYGNKQWANAVLVNSTSRSTYINQDGTFNGGTPIPEANILAYYVWIPRYKYTFPKADGNPETISIIFENKQTNKSIPASGKASGTDYYTHPAFTFGTKELNGIWVGKFETTGTGETPTILPDELSLNKQDVSTQFKTALSFAGGSINDSTGAVSFTGNNTYGLTNTTDSHMMKNSEWGAVAYLSHSQYGINEEIRVNNYVNIEIVGNDFIPFEEMENSITGCGAATPDEYASETCGIPYGTPSAETHTYPQSTTGNITGVFDMSGGTDECVMAKLDNSNYINNSNFTILPSSKYYDLYLQSQFDGDSETNMDKCTLETCGGQALYETAGWYNGDMDFVYEYSSWFIRGGNFSSVGGAGAFSSYYDYGNSSYYNGFRAVLVKGE